MPTNKERREVAENLRNMCICGCRYKEEFYGLLVETVMRAWDFHEFSDVADRLAELIEPGDETCELELTWGGHTNAHVRTYECSRCGKSCDNVWGEDYEFCPYCGRRVEYADE